MLAVLTFIFSSFWIWLGTMMLLGVVVNGVVGVFQAIFKKNDRVVFNMDESKKDLNEAFNDFKDSVQKFKGR